MSTFEALKAVSFHNYNTKKHVLAVPLTIRFTDQQQQGASSPAEPVISMNRYNNSENKKKIIHLLPQKLSFHTPFVVFPYLFLINLLKTILDISVNALYI